MTSQFILILSSIFLAAVFVVAFLVVRSVMARNKTIARRIAGVDGEGELSSASAIVQTPSHLLESLSSHISLPEADEITRIRFQLAQAGFYDKLAVRKFYAIRLISLLLPQFILFFFWNWLIIYLGFQMTLGFAGLVILMGLFAPIYFLRWRTAKRRDECREGFPDMIDLLVASIEAGLSLDMAFSRIAQDIGSRYPVLKVNLDIMNLEFRAGKERHEAMMNFANRIDLEDAKALCVMLKQSEDMGASMGKALRTFSEDMREKRMLIAEEKAMALSAKMTIPLILFIFPTLMVMLMVPAAIRLMEALT